jgi:hypothetical protein
MGFNSGFKGLSKHEGQQYCDEVTLTLLV